MTDRYSGYTRLKLDTPHPKVLRITMDNGKLNTADGAMHAELARIWHDLDADPDINAAIITGAGAMFSAGGDFRMIEGIIRDFEARTRAWREARDIVYNIINCGKPIVSAMRGVAVGAGLVCGLLADISIASKECRIIDGHTRLGVAAGDHAAIIWPLLCGMAKAKYYLLLCDQLLGAGAEPGEYYVVGGTFWQNTVLLNEPVIDPEARLRTLCHVLPGEWMLEGIGFYCGMSMRWFRDAFCEAEVALAGRRGIDPYTAMEESAAQVPPGSGGVVAILSNLMNASRWVHASPSFLQFDLGNPAASGRGACIRAIEEAAAYVARGHRDIIASVAGLQIGELTFTGGAAKGQLWPQIMADVLAMPVHIPVVTESSALGAAICAGVGAGMFSGLRELQPALRRRATTFEPDPAAVAGYDESYARWQQIYGRMLDMSEEGLLNPLWRAAGSDRAPDTAQQTATRREK